MGYHSAEVHSSRSSRSHSGKTSSSDKHLNKHRTSKASKSESKDAYNYPRTSTFLFVVNELELAPVRPTVDQWGTEIPPDYPGDYAGEYPGTVFRYIDGRIEAAPRYTWIRNEGFADASSRLRYPGQIAYQHDDGNFYPMPEYSTYTVFNCWRPLPCVFVEADPMSTLIGIYGNGLRWCLMGFKAPDGTGITRISRSGGASQVVGGRRPTWMPSLVPAMFENTAADIPRSIGLAGPLSVIIGRMALAYPRHRTDEPFTTGMWHHKLWRSGIQLGAEVSEPDNIRGVLVHIALDAALYPEFSTADLLMALENDDYIIKDRE